MDTIRGKPLALLASIAAIAVVVVVAPWDQPGLSPDDVTLEEVERSSDARDIGPSGKPVEGKHAEGKHAEGNRFAGARTLRGEAPAKADTPRLGASRLFAEPVELPGTGAEVSGGQLLAVLERYAPTKFASPELGSAFSRERFSFDGDDPKSDRLIGADLLMRVREQGYEVEVRADSLWIMEAPDVR